MGVELTGEEVGGEEENKSEVREKDGTRLKRKMGEKQIMGELVHEYEQQTSAPCAAATAKFNSRNPAHPSCQRSDLKRFQLVLVLYRVVPYCLLLSPRTVPYSVGSLPLPLPPDLAPTSLFNLIEKRR